MSALALSFSNLAGLQHKVPQFVRDVVGDNGVVMMHTSASGAAVSGMERGGGYAAGYTSGGGSGSSGSLGGGYGGVAVGGASWQQQQQGRARVSGGGGVGQQPALYVPAPAKRGSGHAD